MPLAFVLAGCSSAAEHDSAASTAGPTASNIPNTNSPSITASQAPSPTATPLSTLEIRRDIKVDKLVLFKNDDPNYPPSAPVTVTNHTSTRNTYEVKVALIDEDGKTVLGSSYVTIQYALPGKAFTEDAGFPEAMDVSIPALGWAHTVVESATRVTS
jgi:hypothetical protein